MERATSTAIFRMEGVTKVYDTGEVKVYALAGVDMELYAGEFTVLGALRRRVHRAARPLGQREVDASEHPRRA